MINNCPYICMNYKSYLTESRMGNLIIRQDYTERIAPFVGKNIIKVLTGQRRVGKSCLLRQLGEHIRREHPHAKILFINKELSAFAHIRTSDDLLAEVRGAFSSPDDDGRYLFIDEVQDIQGFEHALRSLLAEEACDIYVTGSNATMLSGELATYLSGRYVEFHVHSLTFSEFLQFHRLDAGRESMRHYLTFGGLPYLAHLPLDADISFEYLRNVYSTILLKDVVKREGIRNVDFLESLAGYVADNVGNLFSANNISRYLKSQRVNISPLQVINYLKALGDAFLVNHVSRIGISGLRRFEAGGKYYFEDLGLRNCYLGFSLQRDIHKLIENAVYLHLHARYPKVFVGQQGEKEVDFVALDGDSRIYVQAAFQMGDESTRRREFGNLLAIPDNYPKYVVSLDEWTSGGNYEGVRHVHLLDFLQMQFTERNL